MWCDLMNDGFDELEFIARAAFFAELPDLTKGEALPESLDSTGGPLLNVILMRLGRPLIISASVQRSTGLDKAPQDASRLARAQTAQSEVVFNLFHQAMTAGREDVPPSFWDSEAHKVVDAAYVAVVKPHMSEYGHASSPVWKEAMTAYWGRLEAGLLPLWTARNRDANIQDDQECLSAYSSAAPRLRYLVQLKVTGVKLNLPLPSTTYIADSRVELERYGITVRWVS